VLRLGGDDPQRLGPYRLKAVIGDGGMGRVYLGTSPAGRAVAVKVIGPGLTERPGYRERFAREARAAMSVSGLYTASVVDADTAGPHPYIATEFVPAPSLSEAVSSAGALPAATVFALAGGLAEALTAIHRAGLVHRDVKPQNILLAPDGPVVIDFGIAMGDEAGLTTVGMMVGTPGYMAPEVLRGQSPSPVSDVFSLACVLVYAARGTGPYGKGDPLAIAHRTANGEPDMTGVPDEVKALVKPMLQRDPLRRPSPAQLLQHVSLSSSVILHDGMWLPDGVRNLLSRHKIDVQRALSESGNGVAAAPTAPPMQPQRPLPPPLMPPLARTPAADFAERMGPQPRPAAGGSRKTFYAAVAAGGVVVMTGAVVTVLLLANGGSSNATTSHTSSSSQHLAAGTSPTATNGSSSAASGVLDYKPGTYDVGRLVATDALGDTVTLASITVNTDGTVTANLTYTDAYAGEWTCSAAKDGETSLVTVAGAEDASTGDTCTRDLSKTWYMAVGQSISDTEYFAQAPSGSGSWSFSIDSYDTTGTPEFVGGITDITIPTS
jgi:serine/threonine protein kinase